MTAPSRFDHVPTTKSNSTRSIAAHPCEKRKDGAPSVGTVHEKIVKGGPPAFETQYPITSMPSSGRVRRLLAYNVSKKRQTVSKFLSPR
jgi:hypothetical protein